MLNAERWINIAIFSGFVGASAIGGTILDVDGAVNGGQQVSNFPFAVSWTSSVAYNDVSISVRLSDGTGTGFAYLTTALGLGTTDASEITQNNFSYSAPSYPTSAWVPVLTNLDLPPGTYYLVLANFSASALWDNAAPATVFLGDGVSDRHTWDSGGILSVGNYPPGYIWNLYDNDSGNLQIQAAASIPEPPSSGLAILGLTSMLYSLCYKRRPIN